MTGEGILVRGVMREKINQVSPFIREVRSIEEHKILLARKLLEEVGELMVAPPESVLEEMADVLQVLYDAGDILGYGPDDIERARISKHAEKGSFDVVMAWKGN